MKKKIRKITAFLLSALLMLPVVSEIGETEVYANSLTNAETARLSATARTDEELVTWNKIDSEADYKEFLALMQQDGGVPILLFFTDPNTNERYVISSEDGILSTSSTEIPVEIDWDFEGEYSDDVNGYTTMTFLTDDRSGDGSLVKKVSALEDGFTLIASGADHVVTTRSAGSFTAVADTSTADTEDFCLLAGDSEDSWYLYCREGYPLWYWKDIEWDYDDYYLNWILPQLSTHQVYSKSMTERVSFDYYNSNSSHAPSSVTLNYSATWKLGTWATTLGGSERKWDSFYIYQETQLPGVYKSNGKWYSFNDAGMFTETGYNPYQHAYSLLCAQDHSSVQFFSACEWVSKKEISAFTGSDCLNYYDYSNKDYRVVGGLKGSKDKNTYRNQNSFYNNINVTCDFEIYYAVEGISLSALYGEANYSANANVIASDDNVAKVYYKKGNTSVKSPSGSSEAALQNSIYTVSKNEVVMIPTGSQLTIEKGATLVVSGGGVLILNGGIVNHGLIIVQSGGMILRYTGDSEKSVNSIVSRPSRMLCSSSSWVSSWISTYGIDTSKYTWDKNSAIICDGGDMIVRKNGRVRVSSLALGSTNQKGTSGVSLYRWGMSKEFAVSHYLSEWTYVPATSSSGSTLLNYGYIQASDLASTSQADITVDGGRLVVGDDYSQDMLLTTSISTLMSMDLKYLGFNTNFDVTVKNGGTVRRCWYTE